MEITLSRDQFCNEIKANFPAVSTKAENEYLSFWGDFDCEFYTYTWFQALARVLNREMNKGVPPTEFKLLFKAIDSGLIKGDESVRQAIDVAFVENLFWDVSSTASELYWEHLPETLKKLYLEFHRKKPF